MNAPLPPTVLRQHLIDPEICIRCNTCEETCPIDAITHDARNYVVDAAKCNACMACISPCPTGAIDNWRMVARAAPYTHRRRSSRGTCCPPMRRDVDGTSPARVDDAPAPQPSAAHGVRRRRGHARPPTPRRTRVFDRSPGATVPPWSASHPYVNLLHAARAGHRDGHRQLPRDRQRRRRATRTTSCSTSAPRRSRCSRASRSASCRRASMPTAGRTSRASIRWRARATASGRATTTSRSP